MRYKVLMILSIVIIIIFISGITYSAFSSGASITVTDQKIANFVFNLQKLNNLHLSLVDIYPNSNNDYLFSVANNRLGNKSNVVILYQITIKTLHLMPLKIELYKLGSGIESLIMECDETYTRNSSNELVCNADVQEMNYSDEIVDNYKIKVVFPIEYNDEEYSNLVDYIDVDIKSWQKLKD